MKIGYARVSSVQNYIQQDILMQELGVKMVFIDRISESNQNRTQLEAMMDFIRAGDDVIVESFSSFAKNLFDLFNLINQLEDKKVNFISKKEDFNTNTPLGKSMLGIFQAIVELEDSYGPQRRYDGVNKGKRVGKYKGRIPIKVDEIKFKELYQKWKKKEIKAVEMQRMLALNPNTFYRRVRQYEKNGKL